MSYCDICGHINGHAYGCPEAPEPQPITHCVECGEPIYIGDEVCQIGNSMKLLCAQCFMVTEVEAPERDEDFEYDKWRDDNLL